MACGRVSLGLTAVEESSQAYAAPTNWVAPPAIVHIVVGSGQHLLLVGAVEAFSVGQRQRSSCRRYRLLCDVMKVKRYFGSVVLQTFGERSDVNLHAR